jgi:outer membrane protein OmpA-like peptidoglycan-associated protein
MDNQESKLRARLQGTGVSVTRVGDDIILNMPSNVTFDTDQSAIKPQFFETLNSVAIVLQEFNRTLVDVTGHTDSTGTPQHNQRLSEARAGSVAEYLIAQGNNPNRFQAIGMGQNDPIASNTTPEGRAQNRRVEIKIVPLT